MDESSPPSPTGHGPQSFYSPTDQYYAADRNQPSFKALTEGRPVSVSQNQPHQRAFDGETNMKRLPTFKDVDPGLEKSYNAVAVDTFTVYDNRGPAAVRDRGNNWHLIEDFAGAHKHDSSYDGNSPYEEVKLPTNSDMCPINPSSGDYQGSGYQDTSGPKSYNAQNFGRFSW